MKTWLPWCVLNIAILGYFAYALVAPASTIKTTLLPGKTTHGHYQIELDCNACHSPELDPGRHSSGNVMQDACNQCHADQLQLAKDTHPASKFNDPTNADRLQILDAQNCLTCHREHVPDQTLASGLTVPVDYCWHCHQEVADSRPSHEGMAFDSCATTGCHNYHDNRALYEKFLNEHHGEEDFFSIAKNPERNFGDRWRASQTGLVSIARSDADGPSDSMHDSKLVDDWADTAHAKAGVNCTACHQSLSESSEDSNSKVAQWSDQVAMTACKQCHEPQVSTFLTGKHGMRLARGLSPMQPSMARLLMHEDAAHRSLDCSSCHQGHRFDTQFAAVDACLQCHADSHSSAYSQSSHADLWEKEKSGELAVGSGVTCATCHLPRMRDGKEIFVSHDQNANLRPSETMAREVCLNCHGLEFSLSSLADPALTANCFDGEPSNRNQSVEMAHAWFEARAEERRKRQKRK